MTVKHPITVEGNLTTNPEHGQTDDGKAWARFTVAVNDRGFNEEAGEWEDRGEPVFHQVAVFGKQAANVKASLQKGDPVVATGDLQFRVWKDDEGNRRQNTQVVAHAVGPSLRYVKAEVARGPKAPSPEAEATGPVAQPEPTAHAAVAAPN